MTPDYERAQLAQSFRHAEKLGVSPKHIALNMAEARTHRIESEIQRVLAELISREVKDPRVGNVTITAVSLAADMGSARVFFTPFASQHPAEDVRVGLTHAGGFLRGEVGRRLRLRNAPRLEFIID